MTVLPSLPSIQRNTFLEYTDAPPTESPAGVGTISCPVCGNTLPENATSCDRCDWRGQGKPESAEGKASDAFAVLLSVLPGLGHIYKGHRLIGVLIIIGTPFAVGLSALAATATAGFGLGLMALYWIGVMIHAYAIVDRVSPSKQQEGEEY